MRIDQSHSVHTPSLEALLWDMDGTLVDTEPMWVKCEEELMADFGYQWSESDALHCIGGPMERVQLYLKEKSGSDLDPAWFGDRLIEMMLERLKNGALLRPGALDLVNEAISSGLRLALVSASRRPIVDAVLEGLPFSFDLSISASEVARSKPHPDGYLIAASKLASTVHSCIVIEDSSVGITSGLHSGAFVLGVTTERFDHHNFHAVEDLGTVSLPVLKELHRSWAERTLARGES